MREQMLELIERDSDFLDAVFEGKAPKPNKEKKQMKTQNFKTGRLPFTPFEIQANTRNGTFNTFFESGEKPRKRIRSYGLKIFLREKIAHGRCATARSFQTDPLKSLSDWPKNFPLQFDWLRAPSYKYQFENLSDY